MHLLYGQRDALDAALFRMWMRRNLVECASALVTLAKRQSLEMSTDDASFVLELDSNNITPQDGVKLAALWQTGGAESSLQKALAINISEPTQWILDQASFYLDNAERLTAKDFTPTDDDIVKTRVITIGVNSIRFVDLVCGGTH